MALPILKWCGGKRDLLPQLLPLLPPEAPSRYLEPFLGGGAMYFNRAESLESRSVTQFVVNDNCRPLIEFYRALQLRSGEVAELAADYALTHTPLNYCASRSAFNRLKALAVLTIDELVSLAGILLYLNKCGFNGLYRVNKRGEFNVPCNPRATWKPDLKKLTTALDVIGGLLSETLVNCMPANDFIKRNNDTSEGEGDFYFVDPPYVPEPGNDGFTSYGSDKFGPEDLVDLRERLLEVDQNGGKFMMTHLDTLFVREHFGRWNFTEVEAPRRIACNGDRKPARELVIRNYG